MSYTFSGFTSINVGDPYVEPYKKQTLNNRTKGKQIISTCTKRGSVGKGIFFSSYEYKSEGEAKKKKEEKSASGDEKKKKAAKKEDVQENTGKTPWRFTSPTKRGSQGLFNSKLEHLQDFEVEKRGAVAKKIDKKYYPCIVTSPAKKGGFGYLGTTFQKKNYEYISDPYFQPVKRKKEEEVAKKEPFFTSVKKKDLFSKYTSPPLSKDDLKKIKENASNVKKKTKEEEENDKKFWKPPHKTSGVPVPKYISPYVPETGNKKKVEIERRSFKPTSLAKTGPTRSILFGYEK